MVHFTDWLPTLLAMTGVALPPDNLPLDGWNILPMLRQEDGKVNTRRFWQWNRFYPYIGSNAAMRDGDWKIVRQMAPQTYRDDIDGPLDIRHRQHPEEFTEIRPASPRSEFSYGPPSPTELYNLRDDPSEQHDLAKQDSARATRMQRELEAWFEDVEASRRSHPDAVFK
jgi:arylsulfatase A-like enzyme